MTTIQIIYLVLGFVSYWIVKAPAVIKDSHNSIHNFKEFVRDNFKEMILSIIGLLFMIFAGPSYPEYLNLTSPVTIFISGGAIPSMFNNLIAALSKKK